MTMAALSEFSGRNWKVLLLEVTLSLAERVSQTTARTHTHTSKPLLLFKTVKSYVTSGQQKQHPHHIFMGRPAA